MTEEQQRFKILKKNSYEDEISQEKRAIFFNTCYLGCRSLTVLLLTSSAIKTANLAFFAISSIETIMIVYDLKNLIKAIAKKTILEDKIEEVNAELELIQNNENRGMSI